MEIKKGALPPKRKKLQRDFDLRKYASSHPKTTLAKLGAIFGITRQRVSIILRAK